MPFRSGALPAALLALTLPLAQPLAAQESVADLPAQTFTLDPSHSALVFSVDHLGFSQFTATFDRFAGTLALDPANPAEARLDVTIDVASLDLPSPPDGFLTELMGPNFFDAGAFPQMTYTSETVTLTGPTTATVAGTLTLLGVAQPVTLDVEFNGNSLPGQFEPWARVGFSATGSLSRSAFGMAYGVPPEGSTLGVGDQVAFRIESEWTGETPE